MEERRGGGRRVKRRELKFGKEKETIFVAEERSILLFLFYLGEVKKIYSFLLKVIDIRGSDSRTKKKSSIFTRINLEWYP